MVADDTLMLLGSFLPPHRMIVWLSGSTAQHRRSGDTKHELREFHQRREGLDHETQDWL